MDEDSIDPLYNCTLQLLKSSEFVNISDDFNHTLVFSFMRKVFEGKSQNLSAETKQKAAEFITNCVLPPRPYDLIWWQKLAWAIAFAVMLFVATSGNLIVIWIVLACFLITERLRKRCTTGRLIVGLGVAGLLLFGVPFLLEEFFSIDVLSPHHLPCPDTKSHRRMRTVINYFLINLSISDLLMSVLNCVCNFIFMLNSNWPFGTTYCLLSNFVSSVTVAAGVFTLMVISFGRYMAIVKPLRHQMSRRKAKMALAIIWVASALLGIPSLVYSTTKTRRYADGQTRIICYMLWPDGAYPTSKTDYVYNLIFLGVTYLIPIIVMAVCYTLMGRKLWGSRSIGELTQRQIDCVKSKRKVVRMFVVVVLIFFFCWLPYHGYFIYAYHNNSVAGSAYVQHVFLLFYWLAMSNAMINPIVFYWMNAKFRFYFRKVIFCNFRSMRRRSSDPGVNLVARMTTLNDLAPSKSNSGKGRSEKATVKFRQALHRYRRRDPKTCNFEEEE